MDFFKLNVSSFYLVHFISFCPLLFLPAYFSSFLSILLYKQEFRIAKGIPARHCTIEHCRILDETMIDNNGCAPAGIFVQTVMRAISYWPMLGPQSTYRGRVEGSVFALSAAAYTTRDGRYSERGWVWLYTTHPRQAGLIFPSWWNARQKVVISTLCLRQSQSRFFIIFPEMEFLDINLTKDLSLLLHPIHSPFYWGILKKPYSSLVFQILTKKSAKQENSSLQYIWKK